MNNWEKMSALADDQLSAEDASAIKMAMQADPSLSKQYESILSLKRSLRNNLPQHDSPETLSICLDRIREVDRVGRTENVVHKFRYALASVLAIAIIGAAAVNRLGGGDIMDRNAISRSLSASITGGGASIENEGQATRWLRDRLNVSLEENRELTLQRWDNLLIDNRPVGRFVYSDGETNYVLLIAPGVVDCDGTPVEGFPGMKHSRINGLNALTWSERDNSYVFAADRPVSALLGYIKNP